MLYFVFVVGPKRRNSAAVVPDISSVIVQLDDGNPSAKLPLFQDSDFAANVKSDKARKRRHSSDISAFTHNTSVKQKPLAAIEEVNVEQSLYLYKKNNRSRDEEEHKISPALVPKPKAGSSSVKESNN